MPPANAKSPDRFKRVKQLGQGAFGRALLVEDPSDGKKKVCKEIEMNKMPKQEKDAALQEAKVGVFSSISRGGGHIGCRSSLNCPERTLTLSLLSLPAIRSF